MSHNTSGAIWLRYVWHHGMICNGKVHWELSLRVCGGGTFHVGMPAQPRSTCDFSTLADGGKMPRVDSWVLERVTCLLQSFDRQKVELGFYWSRVLEWAWTRELQYYMAHSGGCCWHHWHCCHLVKSQLLSTETQEEGTTESLEQQSQRVSCHETWMVWRYEQAFHQSHRQSQLVSERNKE
jgi:hypothetical protein